jgi:hypothetical protein
VEGREERRDDGCECLHSGSFPSSMAMRLLILSLATFAAAMVLVMLSWPRLRPSIYQSLLSLVEVLGNSPITTVPGYIAARSMNFGPKVNEAGASSGDATE